jgi:hypothetical protein
MLKTAKAPKIQRQKDTTRVKIPRLLNLEPQLQKVLPSELRTYASVKAITDQVILETDEGFIFTFQLKEKEGIFTLFTARKNRPRTWLSVDRMLQYLKGEGVLLQRVTLSVL